MDAALTGVRVLDMGRLVAPAYASARLFDLGAQVTKIELAPDGDYLRLVPPLVDGVSLLHRELSRGKQSLGLDWRDPAARAVLHRLVAQADVFIESTLEDAAVRMGLDWVALSAVNPRLVHCSISSFGRNQPYSRLRAHGLNIDAAAGVIPVTFAEDGSPRIGQVTHWVASQAAGLNAALGITAALFARERTGLGRHLDVSCWDAAVSFNYQSVTCHANLGVDFPFPSASTGFGPRYNAYRTRDGRVVLLAAAERKFWERFCVAVGRPDLIGESGSFAYEHADAAAEQRAIAEIIATRTAEDWIGLAVQEGLPITPVHDGGEIPGLEQTRAASMMPATGSFRNIASPMKFAGTPPTAPDPAPEFAGDSVEVLAAYGFDQAEIAALVDQGTVRT